MDKESQFEVNISLDDCRRFADVSGDWNPLHTDPEHAGTSVYKQQVLHGAFSAGLISRLAGMYLPGRDCLLFGMKLRFVNPVLPPVSVVVKGKVVSLSNEVGKVEATVVDKNSGKLYVNASYEFGLHRMAVPSQSAGAAPARLNAEANVWVTGAGGGLGGEIARQLGENARVLRRDPESGRILPGDFADGSKKIEAIIHCAWPTPDNRRFIDIDDANDAVEQQISGPIKDIQVLSALLARYGVPNAPLILVGSTFAKAGRHYFRMPLYSIAKSTIPTLVNILALELASKGKRCYGVVFDMLDGGMNKGISAATRIANADRSPWGELGTTEEAAKQIIWLLENQSRLVNGAMLTLTGGSLP